MTACCGLLRHTKLSDANLHETNLDDTARQQRSVPVTPQARLEAEYPWFAVLSPTGAHANESGLPMSGDKRPGAPDPSPDDRCRSILKTL
jgi:hypothetical protein